MLVLRRKNRQKICIGDDIVITVFIDKAVGKKVIELGIDAPKNVRILREELLNGNTKSKNNSSNSR